MNSENTWRLHSLFPSLYPPMQLDRTLDDSPTLPPFYAFECGDGWVELLERLSRSIVAHAEFAGIRVSAVQVKEKYGELRFYIDTADEEIYRLIDDAEAESATICDICGSIGTLKTEGWWSTRCSACWD